MSADTILLNTIDFEVKDEMGDVTIRRKPGFSLILGGGLIALAMAFQFIPIELLSDDPHAIKAVFKALSSVLILLGALIIMIYILFPSRNIRIVDKKRGSILYEGDCIPFTKVSEITLRSTSIQNVTSLSIVALVDGKELFLVPGQLEIHRSEMEELTALLRECIFNRTQTERPAPEEAEPSPGLSLESRFLAAFFLILGILFSVFTYAYAPRVVIVAHGAELLLWPFGFWIAAIGVAEIFKIPAWKTMSKGPLLHKLLFDILWTGSYFLICMIH